MLAGINFRNNRKYDKDLPEGMINGQDLGAVREFRYGLFSFGWCGCEIIAVYNLLKMLGRPRPLSEICREIYPYGQVLWGFFGTNVYVLKRYLKKHGVPAQTVYSKDVFLAAAPHGRCGVVSFWTGGVLRSSVHTVAYRVAEDGKIVIYNRYNKRNFDHIYDDIEEAFGKYPFIVGHML